MRKLRRAGQARQERGDEAGQNRQHRGNGPERTQRRRVRRRRSPADSSAWKVSRRTDHDITGAGIRLPKVRHAAARTARRSVGVRPAVRAGIPPGARGLADRIRRFAQGAEARGRARSHRGILDELGGIDALAWSRCAIESVIACGAADRTESDPSWTEWEAPGTPRSRSIRGREDPGADAGGVLDQCTVVHAAFGRVRQRAETRQPSAGSPAGGLAAAGGPELLRISTVTRSHGDGRRPAVAGQERRGAAGALGPGRRPYLARIGAAPGIAVMTRRQVMSERRVEPVMTVTCLGGTSRTELYRFASTPLNEVAFMQPEIDACRRHPAAEGAPEEGHGRTRHRTPACASPVSCPRPHTSIIEHTGVDADCAAGEAARTTEGRRDPPSPGRTRPRSYPTAVNAPSPPYTSTAPTTGHPHSRSATRSRWGGGPLDLPSGLAAPWGNGQPVPGGTRRCRLPGQPRPTSRARRPIAAGRRCKCGDRR